MSTLVTPAKPTTPPSIAEPRPWQAVLAEPITDAAELCRSVGVPASEVAGEAERGFPLLVPRTYVARMRPGDRRDPLLLQVLPRAEEAEPRPGFTTDPLGEADAPGPCGLLRKYEGRSLIVASPACAVHCRFCFRRHYPYPSLPKPPICWRESLQRLARDASIREVILSGGDPLTLDDPLLAGLAHRLAGIPHLCRLRVHTRLPIVVPQRVTEELVAWLRGTRLTPVVVVHVNHAAEIDAQVAAALARLVDAGVPVLSQSVLLRGVNDCVDVLAALCERLVDLRVMPYYLHQLDRVAGAAHFEVPEPTGAGLIQQLRTRLPGYAVPRYVRERKGARSKQAIA